MTSEPELAQAFAPCTLQGLADAWNADNAEIARIRKERDAIERVLLEASMNQTNGKDEPWREGAVIQGKDVAVVARWRLVSSEPQKWEPRLEIVR